MKKNIFLALDFNSLDKALKTTEETKDYLAGIKIGLELYSVIGLKGVKEFEKFKLPIFLDTKIFDIPNQVAKTIKIISEIKIDVPTYTKKNLPNDLASIAVTTPGSRFIK